MCQGGRGGAFLGCSIFYVRCTCFDTFDLSFTDYLSIDAVFENILFLPGLIVFFKQ